MCIRDRSIVTGRGGPSIVTSLFKWSWMVAMAILGEMVILGEMAILVEMVILGEMAILVEMAMHGHIWPYIAIYGHAWPYMAIYGHIWPCMAISTKIAISPKMTISTKMAISPKMTISPKMAIATIHDHLNSDVTMDGPPLPVTMDLSLIHI